jgi:hypothetical protein
MYVWQILGDMTLVTLKAIGTDIKNTFQIRAGITSMSKTELVPWIVASHRTAAEVEEFLQSRGYT